MDKIIAFNLISICVVAAAIGIYAGRYNALPEEERVSKEDGWFEKVLMGILVISLLVVIGTGAVMLFLFRWVKLARNFLWAMLCCGLFWLDSWIHIRWRRLSKYLRNPVVREVAMYCKMNGVVAIQCLPDGVRYFTGLVNSGYCKNADIITNVADVGAAALTRTTYVRPAEWSAYDSPAEYAGSLRFADRGYTNVTHVDQFGKALRWHLHGYGMASHVVSTSYSTTSYSGSTKTVTNHITRFYADTFVYKRSVLRAVKEAERAKETAAQKARQKAEKAAAKAGPKSWE